MKEGLVQLTQERNIFYDSIEKVYRYRMHCPNCRKEIPTCRCYHDLDKLLSDIDDRIADYTCTSKCALLIGDFDELSDVMEEKGHSRDTDIEDLTEEECTEIMEIITRDADFDTPGGEACTV